MFPPLVLTRSGSKGQHLTGTVSTGHTGSPTILMLFIFSDTLLYQIKEREVA